MIAGHCTPQPAAFRRDYFHATSIDIAIDTDIDILTPSFFAAVFPPFAEFSRRLSAFTLCFRRFSYAAEAAALRQLSLRSFQRSELLLSLGIAFPHAFSASSA